MLVSDGVCPLNLVQMDFCCKGMLGLILVTLRNTAEMDFCCKGMLELILVTLRNSIWWNMKIEDSFLRHDKKLIKVNLLEKHYITIEAGLWLWSQCQQIQNSNVAVQQLSDVIRLQYGTLINILVLKIYVGYHIHASCYLQENYWQNINLNVTKYLLFIYYLNNMLWGHFCPYSI